MAFVIFGSKNRADKKQNLRMGGLAHLSWGCLLRPMGWGWYVGSLLRELAEERFVLTFALSKQ